jgi:hypothetical protein
MIDHLVKKQLGPDIRLACAKIAHQAGFSSLLKGACSVASYALFLKLRQMDFQPTLVVGKYFTDPKNGHAWVEHEGRIFDLTHSQYGKPKINITSVDDPFYQRRITNRKAVRYLRCFSRENIERYTFAWPNGSCHIERITPL